MKSLIKKLIYYPAIVFTKGFFVMEHLFAFKSKESFKFGFSLNPEKPKEQEIEVFLFREEALYLTVFYQGEKTYTPDLKSIQIRLTNSKKQIIQPKTCFVACWAITPLSFTETRATGKENYQERLSILAQNPLLEAFGKDVKDCFTVVYVYDYQNIPKESEVEIIVQTDKGLYQQKCSMNYQKKRKWF